jgi:hypothetical protein
VAHRNRVAYLPHEPGRQVTPAPSRRAGTQEETTGP